MDEGFILSNKYRRIIFESLANGETNIDRIAKKHRIILLVARKVANDFTTAGIIEKKDNRYLLTDEGKKLAEKIIE